MGMFDGKVGLVMGVANDRSIAWAITEAAYARGFDSPHRTSYHSLTLSRSDYILMAGTTLVIILLYWRW